MDILDAYNQRRHRIDVIANDAALFLLGYLHELGGAERETLEVETGWPPAFAEQTISLLIAGRCVEDTGRLYVTPSGRQLLETTGLVESRPEIAGALVPAALVACGIGVGLGLTASSRRPSPFWLGLMAGIAAGVLYAPASGRDTRGSLRRRGSDVQRALGDWIDDRTSAWDRQARAMERREALADSFREDVRRSDLEVPGY
jgi:hypothetical protein